MNILFNESDFSDPLLEVSNRILTRASLNNIPPFIILIDLLDYLERLINDLIGCISAEKLSLEYQKPTKNKIHFDFNDAINSKYLTEYDINHNLLVDVDNSILNDCINEAISSTISHFQPNLEHIQSTPLNDQTQEINNGSNSPHSKFPAKQLQNSDSNPKRSSTDFLICTLDSAYGKSEISTYSLPFELQFETISRLQDIDNIDKIFEPYFDFSAQFIETCFELLKSIYAKLNLTESNKRVIQEVSSKNSSTLTHNRLVELLLSRTDKINTEIMHLYLASSESLCRNFNVKSLPQLHNSKLTCSLFTKFFKLGIIDTADFKAELSSFCLTYIWTKEAAALYSIVSEK
ncbi:hypothetical protein AYI70_g11022 [Smittium culicis]|uniref:Uncharacterized protein n=1 Tax=Smittium culicis TaxID=133412 RepID=A0A1R1X3T1_9FUNG|nr:hypothetical protein AYI70_g11022 [Smittium culicis]